LVSFRCLKKQIQIGPMLFCYTCYQTISIDNNRTAAVIAINPDTNSVNPGFPQFGKMIIPPGIIVVVNVMITAKFIPFVPWSIGAVYPYSFSVNKKLIVFYSNTAILDNLDILFIFILNVYTDGQ